MGYIPKLKNPPDWFTLRIYSNFEKVAPKSILKAWEEICDVFVTSPIYVSYEGRMQVLKALTELWKREAATEEEIDKLNFDAATYLTMRDETDAEREAKEEERKRKEEEERSRKWYERIMQEKQEEWARERAEAEADAAKKKGRKR